MRCLFFLCGVIALLTACSSGYYMRRGNVIYETGRFYKASAKYEKAYDKAKPKTARANAALCAGRAYEDVNKLKDAYSWYRRAERADKEMPEVYLKMAQVCCALNDIETARECFTRYEELTGDGKGKDGLYYLDQVGKDLQEQGRYQIWIRREFNSRNMDFSPVYQGEDTTTVYLASGRKEVGRKRVKTDPVTGDGYTHIYKTRFVQEIKTTDKQGRVKMRRFKEPRWLAPVLLRDSLYSNRSEGAMCFADGGNTMFFTSSRMLKGSNCGTRIYKATRKAGEEEKEGKEWMTVALAGICGDTLSIGHPAITPDGSRMYFVSDALPGGFGGKDIWYVEAIDGSWGEPVNAGEEINTSGDEMFPYVRENGELYFASNGHYGFGGLDLFKVFWPEGKPVVHHLPAPLNSYADDFGIIFQPGRDAGMITSGRAGRSDNIFSFQFIPQQLQVNILVENNVTEWPVVKAEISVTADDGEVSYLETDSLGRARMDVMPDREYVFVAGHPRFLKGKGMVSTYREKDDRTYEVTIPMQPIEKPIVIPNIYFDVAKWDLRPDAQENLEELLTILKDNPNITIELSAHTDMVGNDRSNMVLSENRAQSVVDYLIEKGVYWDRLEAKGYGETQPRLMNEKDVREYSFLKVGDVLTERFVNRLKGEQREIALQLNRRIEFKVLRTNYKPGPQSLHNPNQKAVAAEEGIQQLGTTRLRDLKEVSGKFYTLQLGIFSNVPALIYQFKNVFTEKMKDGGVRYCTGIYDTREEANAAAGALKKKGVDCLVKEFDHRP